MAKVNPPPHLKIPKQFFEKKDTRSYFQQVEFILFQLWTRTGGGSDENLANTEGLRQFEDIDYTAFFPEPRHASPQSADYSTVTSEIIICKNNITVTLNNEPCDQELVTINATSFKVIIGGNGRTISGDAEVVIRKSNTAYPSLDLIYVSEEDAWFIV